MAAIGAVMAQKQAPGRSGGKRADELIEPMT
jgi:hypothetical protein